MGKCINCAFCSIGYPSFVESCDRDGHTIADACNETCELFDEYVVGDTDEDERV